MQQVRRILEPEATRLATPRLSNDDLVRLEECLRCMDVEHSAQAFIEADTAFHRVVEEVTENRNRGHDTPARPATHAIVSRKTETKRPKKTARPP
jgi:DNA-binding FadR family transcriptional regulator